MKMSTAPYHGAAVYRINALALYGIRRRRYGIKTEGERKIQPAADAIPRPTAPQKARSLVPNHAVGVHGIARKACAWNPPQVVWNHSKGMYGINS